MIDPMIEALTTSWRPSSSAKKAITSSGKFPKVTFSRPPMPGPERAASSSVALPIIAAVGMMPSAAATKIARCAGVRELEHERNRDQRREQVGPAVRAEQPAPRRPPLRRVGRHRGRIVEPGAAARLDARVRTRSFGTTDLRCSEIGFGTWALGSNWWGDVSQDDGVQLIHRALELGITFFDTGDVYGKGANEEIVARALAGVPRESVQLSTKFGYVLDEGRQEHSQGERPQDWSPEHARNSLEASLRRLGTDYVDLYQLHNPRMDAIARTDLFAELERLKDEGKLRHYGVALGPAIGWRDEGMRALAEYDITSVQTVYNVLEQDPGRDFLAAAEEKGAAVLARVPTSSGLLEDKYTLETTFPKHDHRSHRPREWLVEGLQKVERLRFLSEEHGITMAQAALRFVLAQPAIACVLPTVSNAEDLEEWAGASDAPDLTADDLERISELYERNFDVEPVRA